MIKPLLLTKYDMLEPIEFGLSQIEKIHATKLHWGNNVIREGMFIMLFSSFEVCLSDTLEIFLVAIPGNIPLDEIKLTKKEIMDDRVTNKFTEKYLSSLGYRSLVENVAEFRKIFGVSIPCWNKYRESMIEFK